MEQADLRAELVKRQVFGNNIHAVVDVIEPNGDRWTMSCDLEGVGRPEMRPSMGGEPEGCSYLNQRYGRHCFSQAVVRAVLDAPSAPFDSPGF